MIPLLLLALAVGLLVFGLRTDSHGWRTLGGIAAVALWPIASVLVASGVAGALGCQLDEAGVHPCLLGGADVGGALSTAFVAGWAMLFTLPLGLALAVAWAIRRATRTP